VNLYFELHLILGAEDFTPEQDVEEVRQIEKQVKRRFAIGTQVNVLQKTTTGLYSPQLYLIICIHACMDTIHTIHP